MFAYFTLVMYLVVGSVAVRFYMSETSVITISTNYLSLFSPVQISEVTESEKWPEVEMKFAEIHIPKVNPIAKKIEVKKVVSTKLRLEKKKEQVAVVSHLELPFHEPVILKPIYLENELPQDLISLYHALPEIEVQELVADTITPADKEEVIIEDKVSSSMAKSEDVSEAEPEFFEYPQAEEAKLKATAQAESKLAPRPTSVSEQINVSNIIAFDYSSAQKDVAQHKVPTVSRTVTTHPQVPPVPNPVIPTPQPDYPDNKSKNAPSVPQHPVQLTIQAVGTDLKKTWPIMGFEVRAQDDLSEVEEDYGSGEVKHKDDMATSKMTRSVVLVKRGFLPTNTDLILEEGVAEISIPLIDEEGFHHFNEGLEARGSIGAVLVELDDETELAKLDVPFGKVLKLDGDLKVTEGDDYRYQLFLGVRAGNALLTYQTMKNEKVSKVIHIHEGELTYEANFYENAEQDKVKLYEQDLLAKETSPLIMGEDQVKIFATETVSSKLDDHTYQLNFGPGLLAGRRYLELNHQSEPIYVGLRNNFNVIVPSENFMRFVLSKFEGARLGNRCLVQVNLTKVAERMEVASESVASSLMTYTQVLDNDGKFYESLSEKSEKIIIIGENQGASELSQEGKINIKIQYQDGSSEYLSSYCSPNTYLVEQL